LQHVLDVVRRQRLAQARGEPRRVPGEQFPQHRVVAVAVAVALGGGDRLDQLVVVHHHIYCTWPGSGSR